MIAANRARFAVILVALSVLVAEGCSLVSEASVEDPVRAQDVTEAPAPTVSLAPVSEPSTTTPSVTDPPTTPPPATAPAATEPDTTESATTEPVTTEPESTTGSPTQPKPPRTTTTTLPVPLRPVPAPETPLVAVGQSSGAETARVQQRLLDLGYWHAGPDGSYGHTTTQAVMAFQKYMGLNASGSVDQATADALSTVTERPRGYSTAGDLIEIDKQRQLLFVIRRGLTELVLNTSTGNGEEYTEEDQNTPGKMISGVSLTPNGLYRVDRERPEGWWEGDLGEIYRPKYFRGGIAVHGSSSIPNYPASHGCVRVSVPAMDMIWAFDLMPMWSTVWVHEGI